MGILSGIAKGLDYVSGLLRSPGTAITNPKKVIAESKAIREKTASGEMSLGQNIQKSVVPTVVNTAVAASLVVGGAGIGSKLGSTSVKKIATSLVPKSTAGKVIGATIGLPAAALGTGLVIANPKTAIEGTLNAPSSIVNYGTNLVKLGAGKGSIKETFADNPVLAGTTIAVLGLAGVKLLGTGGAYLAGKLADGKDAEGVLGTDDNIPPTSTPKPEKNAPDAVIPTNTSTPQLPPTQVVTSSTARKKRRIKKQPTIMKQTTNIQILNKNSTKFSTKKYLNALVH